MSGLRMDRDELALARAWCTDGGRSFLDRQTGEVIAWTGADDPEHAEEELDAGLGEDRLIPIARLPSSVEHGWMQKFAARVANSRLRHRLEAALAGRGAFRWFKDALISHPSERAAWFAFRGARVRYPARGWAEENGVADESFGG